MKLRFFLLSILILSSDVSAQVTVAQPGTTTQGSVVEKLDRKQAASERMTQLVAKVKTISREVDRLQDEVGGDGFGSTIVRLEIHRKSNELQEVVSSLITALKHSEELGIETAVETKLIEELLLRDAHTLKTEAIAQSKRVRILFDRTETGSASERVDAELSLRLEMPILEILDNGLIANLSMREIIGVDVSADRKALIEDLRLGAQLQIGVLRALRRSIEITAKLLDATGDKSQVAALQRLKDLRRVFGGSMRSSIRNLGKFGENSTQLKQQLISLTGELSDEVLDPKVISPLVSEWLNSGIQWLRSNGPSFIFKLFLIVLILVVARMIARLAERLVRHGLRRPHVRVSNLLRDFLIKTAGRIVLVFGILIGIAQLGIEIGPLLAGLGIAGFIVGFALQDVLSNFASGLMILFYRPFDVGDTIEAAGIRGKVNKMTLVSTMVLTFDNQLLVVPNNKIWGDVIRNVTHQTQRRIDFMFGIHYKDDIEHAERVFMDILKSHEKVLEDPEPVVRVHELGDSSVNFAVRPWVKTDDYWDVYWDITREVKRRLDAEGITIPFPQRDVHHYAEKAGDKDTVL